MNCRNCQSSNTILCPDGAIVAPFFADRVWGIRNSTVPISRKMKIANMLTGGAVGKIMERTRSMVAMDAVICEDCSFWSTSIEIPTESLENLYRDYRQPSYNTERDKYEPGYIENIANFIGGEQEARNRVTALDGWLKAIDFSTESLRLLNSGKLLDWGGADGRFLPSVFSAADKLVYDISNCSPIKGIKKISSVPEGETYDYIQIAHTLEHVSNPYNFLQDPVSSLSENGFLYLEVPLEVEPATFENNVLRQSLKLYVHEHINKYTLKSLRALVISHRLWVVDSAIEEVDFSWAKGLVVRLLARRIK